LKTKNERKKITNHKRGGPVVENKKFLGLISKASMLDHYRKELEAQTEEF